MEVTVVNRQRGRRISGRALESFVDQLAKEEPPPADGMSVCLVSDRRMRELNRRFRQQDRTTDVLSFCSNDEPDPDGSRYLGDLVICIPAAARQARDAGHSLARELRILLIHGYLHLLGHDHVTDGGAMMRLQRKLVRRLLPARRGAR